MRKVLQIVFCILAVLSVVSVFFLGAFLGFVYALIGIVAAVLFGFLMLQMKRSGAPPMQDPDFTVDGAGATNQEKEEGKEDSGRGNE